LFFRSYYRLGLCIKGAGPTSSTEPQGAEVVFQIILAGLCLAALKVTGPTFNRTKELTEVIFIIFLAGLFGLCSITGRSYFQPNQGAVVFSDHILAGLSLCSIKGTGPTSTGREPRSWRLFFRSYFGRPFRSPALKRPVLLFNRTKGLEVVFRSYFGRPSGSAALKVLVLLFNRTKELRLFFQIIFVAWLLVALKVPVLSLNHEPIQIILVYTSVYQWYYPTNRTKEPWRLFFFQIIFCRPFWALQH
jgi:hypothetical protein